MKQAIHALFIISVIALGGSWAAGKDQVIIYPNAEAPLFSIEVPGNWKLTEAIADDQFFLVAGPAGVEMWFRAKTMTSEKEFDGAINAATASGKEWLLENYADVVLAEVVFAETEGMPYASANGAGVSKATNEAVTFTMAFIAMPNGALAQFWSIIPKRDSEGVKYAEKVLKSFRPL